MPSIKDSLANSEAASHDSRLNRSLRDESRILHEWASEWPSNASYPSYPIWTGTGLLREPISIDITSHTEITPYVNLEYMTTGKGTELDMPEGSKAMMERWEKTNMELRAVGSKENPILIEYEDESENEIENEFKVGSREKPIVVDSDDEDGPEVVMRTGAGRG
jgi:hypothetical protein